MLCLQITLPFEVCGLPTSPGCPEVLDEQTVAAPSAEASGAAGRLPEIRPGIRLRLCWPGFVHRPAFGVPLDPFEGKELSAFGRFRSGLGPFPGP
jgi:hypothetical protein